MLAVQREAEAELGDVTAMSDAHRTKGASSVAPSLLKAMADAGVADLISGDRSSQLDTLLAKASQYSTFIRDSQGRADTEFKAHALKAMAEEESEEAAGGKRKKGGKGAATKKTKGEGEGTSFEDAKAMQEASKGSAADLWQPKALQGRLKDYQLEG